MDGQVSITRNKKSTIAFNRSVLDECEFRTGDPDILSSAAEVLKREIVEARSSL